MGRSYKKADKCNAAVRGKALISEVELHRGWRWSEDFQMKGDQVRLFYRCTNMSRIATWHQCIACFGSLHRRLLHSLPIMIQSVNSWHLLCWTFKRLQPATTLFSKSGFEIWHIIQGTRQGWPLWWFKDINYDHHGYQIVRAFWGPMDVIFFTTSPSNDEDGGGALRTVGG